MTKKEERELKKQQKLEAELLRLEGMTVYEKEYAAHGLICGIDEVGRGPLAGPVVAGAVILPPDCRILYLNDSKKLTERRRELLYDEIMEKAVAVGIGVVSQEMIDEINILQATYEAYAPGSRKIECPSRCPAERCSDDTGTFTGTDSDYQGRCQKSVHCGSQCGGQSNQRPDDGSVG